MQVREIVPHHHSCPGEKKRSSSSNIIYLKKFTTRTKRREWGVRKQMVKYNLPEGMNYASPHLQSKTRTNYIRKEGITCNRVHSPSEGSKYITFVLVRTQDYM